MLGATPRPALVIAVLVSGPGCSYALVHGPPAPHPDDPREVRQAAPDCTSSNAVPIVDTVLAVPLLGAGVLGIVGGAAEGCGSYCFGPSSGETIVIGAALTGLGVLMLSSAITGYGRTADCRRAREALPTEPTPTGRYLLDVPALVDERARGSP
jgi:hypothetical protein